jgi:hypothetical protein
MTGYVAADPRDPSRLYVSLGEVGLFRLDDAGVGTVEGGQIVPQPVGELPFPGPIAVRSDGAVYAVELPSASGGPAILTSEDLGAHWSTVSDPFFAESGGFVRTLEVAPDSALWAGLYGDGMVTRAAPTYDLTVSTTGSGEGGVTSDPAAIDCGAVCSAPVPWGTAVTLAATPEATSTFTGWSGGGCSGTGTCRLTMTRSEAVTASFVSEYRPDGLLGTSTSPFVGNDIYNTTGVNQSLSQRVSRGRTGVFRWKIQNDGASADRFALLGPSSSSRFQIAYVVGTTNVTKAVVAGTYVKSLAANAHATITVKVTVAKGTASGSSKSLALRATSRSVPLKDVVMATVRVR